MISTDNFIQGLTNMPYAELIRVRDKLLIEIRKFEEDNQNTSEGMISPSPAAIYQRNLKYLEKVCELIAGRFKKEIDVHENQGRESQGSENFLFKIREYLDSKGLRDESIICEQLKKRKEGKTYSFEEHIRAMIYAMLSNQTKWFRIEPHLTEIDKLFFDYNPSILKSTPGEYFEKKIYELKCGNVSTKYQMEALPYNISILESIEKEFGSVDTFVLSAPAYVIVRKLSKKDSKYKLKMLGEALTWEYLRNVGIDGAKPDVHLRRFFSGSRMGNGTRTLATPEEVYRTVLDLSKITDLPMAIIDNYIWSYCADGHGKVCASEPNCSICVIRQHCNYSK